MLDNISKRLKMISTSRSILLLAFFFTAMYLLMYGQPFGIAELNERFCNVTILDLRESYTPDEAYKLFEALGVPGRFFYARLLLLLDFAFPLSYMLFWAAAITYLFHRLLPKDNLILKLNLFPVAAALFDYLENFLILDMLFTFPKRVNIVAVLANYMTIAKNFFMWISLIVLLLGLVLYVGKLIIKSVSANR